MKGEEKVPNKKGLSKEEKEFRKLQRAIAALPKPSFNNPEKAQPLKDVSVPSAVPSSLLQQDILSQSGDDKIQKPADTGIILDKGGKKIERLAGVKKPKKLKVVGRVLHYAKKHWWLLALSIFFGLINSIFEIATPLIIGNAIDYIVGPNDVAFDMIGKYLIALGVCIVAFSILKWLTTKTANDLSYRIEQSMHDDIFNKLNHVPLKFIDGASHGDIQSRMINDVDQITDGFILGLTTFFDGISTIAMTVVFMFRINIPIAIAIVCITPVTVIIAGFIAKRTHKLFKQQAKELGDLSGTLVEMLGNQKIVKAFEYEDDSIQKFDDINTRMREVNRKATFYSTLSGPISRFINGILYAIVAIMGCLFALKGAMTIGNISTLLSYANRYTRPFNEITDVFADIQAAFASAGRVFSILDIKDEVSDFGMPEIKRCTGNINLKNVEFSYTQTKNL